MIKTRDEIVNDLITSTIAKTDKITYFGEDSVIKAIYTAVANIQFEIWNDLYQTRRQLFVQTASGSDLDTLAGKYGLLRRGATKGSVILVFNGENGVEIPAGTQVKTANGIVYETKNSIILGTKNPTLARPLYSNILGDTVLAESVEYGSKVKVNVGELNIIATSGIKAQVTNLLPSVSGYDQESDEEFRKRIMQTNDLLGQGTYAFYEALAKKYNENVIRANVIYAPTANENRIFVVKNTLTDFTQDELNNLAQAIKDNQKAYTGVTCFNAVRYPINFDIAINVASGYTLDQVYNNIAIALTDYFDVTKAEFGCRIKYYDVVGVVSRTEGVAIVNDFLINNGKKDLILDIVQIAQLNNITIRTIDNTQTANLEETYLIT